jgi:small conductance mechanosensitive channel
MDPQEFVGTLTQQPQFVATLTELVSVWALRVVGAVAVLILGRWISAALRRAAVRGLARANTDPTLVPFLSGIVYYVALAVVVIAVLGLFGIETTSLVAVLGAAGLAIGLALQGTLSNFSSGVMLLVFRPFKTGDFVDVAGTKGTVREVGIFTTVLDTPDNVRIVIPNSSIYGTTITNYSAYATRRIDLVVGVAYEDDLATAEGVIQRVLESEERVLDDPPAQVAVSELGDSSVNFVVRPWCRSEDYWPRRFDLTRRLKEALEQGGCSIPFPQRDVHLIRDASA